ncbi:FMN reductase [Sphaerisporangium krabiense]|uniref:NAD(P)H-dependent FMN reductase n=1 Tax=Sphaerisporangium krabiense TaxID=763782 RepID=A0A7W9DTW3_9ACTN|nr:NAD(P)H-dependent oxidoreductase [Sphaerisporangium krabiense]MBB5631297.1 NAD(P)H-dependent FMN reductase [Sphaerisporangium krabiense]GII60714.1 FMN reductase [Sphaerisporangium krabiense]
MRIAIITGSTRQGRKSEAVAQWVHDLAVRRGDAEYEVLDIARFGLPLFDEAVPPAVAPGTLPHTTRWAEAIRGFDAFVFVTPEYNHGTSGALKNAIDFLYEEWHGKAAGFVGYGVAGGTRAVEQLRLIMGNLRVADVSPQVSLSLFTDFTDMTALSPAPHQEQAVTAMLDEVAAWGGALRALRAPAGAAAA